MFMHNNDIRKTCQFFPINGQQSFLTQPKTFCLNFQPRYLLTRVQQGSIVRWKEDKRGFQFRQNLARLVSLIAIQ